jgi:DNA-binding transcriptional regulator YdaS (Cro superfamily)
MDALAHRLLSKAAQKIGGTEFLARRLAVSPVILKQWIDRKDVPPAEIFHKALDILLDDSPDAE